MDRRGVSRFAGRCNVLDPGELLPTTSQAEALYHSVDGKYIPDLAEHITTALVDGT